jgi:hypothetical protein
MARIDLPIKTQDLKQLPIELDFLCDLMRSYEISYQIVWPPNKNWWFWSISGLDDSDATKLTLLW